MDGESRGGRVAGVTYKRVSYDLFVIGLLTLITFVPIVHYTNFRSTFLAQGYSPLVQRAVKVHLNILVPKWDDDARSQLNCDECALDIAGGFSWQNRILFPAILLLVTYPLGLNDHTNPSSGFVFLGLMFLSIFFALASIAFGIGRTHRSKSFNYATLLATLLFLIVLYAPPKLLNPSDFIQVGLFVFIVDAILRNSFMRLALLTVTLSLVRETSVFVPVLYFLMHVPKLLDIRAWSMDFPSRKLMDVTMRTILLFVLALTSVIIPRAILLGGIGYAFGVGAGADAYTAAASGRLSSLVEWAPLTWFFLFVALGVPILLQLWKKGSRDPSVTRLLLGGSLIVLISLVFVNVRETRVFAQLIPIGLFSLAMWNREMPTPNAT